MTQRTTALSAHPPATSRWLLMALIGAGLGLMTMVIVIQGRTIETQRELIRCLFEDSTALNQLRNSMSAEKRSLQSAPPTTPDTKAGSPPAATQPPYGGSRNPAAEPSPNRTPLPPQHPTSPQKFPAPPPPAPAETINLQQILRTT